MRKLLAALCIIAMHSQAQRHEILDSNIASLQVMSGTNWQGMPIATLGGEGISISFDELSHEYHRYIYTIQHCEADWTPSEALFTSDYITGFYDDNIIDNYEQSIDTYQQFTHYRLDIPNDRCRITMSGNYKVTIIDDESNTPVLKACFMIDEGTAGVSLDVTTNTDLDINGRHQQVNMQVTYGKINVTSPDEQLTTVVMQNQRWDTAVNNPKAQFRLRDGMKWEHCHELIFNAGSECHKFETLDPSHTTMGLAAVGWDKELSQWHAYIFPDVPAKSYTYDVDANGSFLIRNSDNIDNDLRSDYIVTHFELHAPRQHGPVFLNGAWTYDTFVPQYEMEWNNEKGIYEKAIHLKQGYYSYRYLVMDEDGTMNGLAEEGNFFETENTYQALLYFRGPTDRADRLVATASVSTRQ